MADAAEQLVVTIEPELPLEPDKIIKLGEGDGKTPETDAVADLKAQFEESQKREADLRTEATAARQREAAARQDATKARQEAQTARTEVVESQYDTITSGLDAAKTEADAAQTEYQSAMEAGDFAKAAKAQRRMSSAEAKIVRLDEAKADVEARKAQPQDDTARRVETPAQPTDQVEAYIANRTEPTANWLRSHREYITDPKKNARLTAAHYAAVAEDIAPDSPEYFERVETYIGLRKAPETQQRTPVRGKSPPVAPVQQSGGGTSGNGTEVRLSQGEARAAQDGTHVWNYDDPSGQKRFRKGDAIGIQEFARRKSEMTKQGLYDKTYVES